MCGISGIYDYSNQLNKDLLIENINSMCKLFKHRGPDNYGYWIKNNIIFGHNRLSIQDVSNNGNQPMVSNSGRFIITFNGEIYNVNNLRKYLLNHINFSLKSSTDTEVLVEIIELVGINKALSLLEGMFAFAIFDIKELTLFVTRDRVGIKPLYWSNINNFFLFSSEISSIKKFHKDLEIDRDSLASFFRHNYVPAPHSIYKNVYKLEPGKLLIFKDKKTKMFSYWDLSNYFRKEGTKNKSYSLKTVTIETEKILTSVVKDCMISDVPLGSFLSGGIDSSLITYLMQKQSKKKIKTFTIGFDFNKYNEATYAKKIADFIGTEHTEIIVNENDALETITRLPEIYSEPFADSSQIPTYIISKMCRKNIKVALSGDGGDEMFGGYNRYSYGAQINSLNEIIPSQIRDVLSKILVNDKWVKIITKLENFFPLNRIHNFSGKMFTLSKSLISRRYDIYKAIISHTQTPNSLVLNSSEKSTPVNNPIDIQKQLPFKLFMRFTDMISYLPDDILTKVDRASMFASLEVRVPFLEKKLIDFTWNMKINDQEKFFKKKVILKKILAKYIPKSLFDRPKMGFGIPLNFWINEKLKDWVKETLDLTEIKNQGYLDVKEVKKILNDKNSDGYFRNNYLVWDLLMFQSWYNFNK